MKPLTFPDLIGRFQAEWLRRLAEGAKTYGDASYERTADDLLDEIQQECIDLAGWGYVLWLKCERIKGSKNEFGE